MELVTLRELVQSLQQVPSAPAETRDTDNLKLTELQDRIYELESGKKVMSRL
jgi:hypothetical protein